MLGHGRAAEVFSRKVCHRGSVSGACGALELVLLERLHDCGHHVSGERVAIGMSDDSREGRRIYVRFMDVFRALSRTHETRVSSIDN